MANRRAYNDSYRSKVASRGLGDGFFVGCALVGSVLRLLLFVYFVCARGALCCFLIKFARTYKKKSGQ
jgi:hypothetical protein